MSTQTKVQDAPKTTKKISISSWMVVFAIFAVVGVVCWILQLTKGLQVTNLSVINMWGLYIIFFMIFTGVAAGCLFFASTPYLFSNLEEFKPYTKIASYVSAVASIVAASLFIIVDIGNPERAWLFITSGNFTSPMFWDFLMLASYMFISVIFTGQLLQVNEGKKSEKSLKPIATVAFIAGILVLITSFVFTFQVSRPHWNTPAQSVSFLIAAFVAALAVLIVLAFILNKSGYIRMPKHLISKLGKTAAVLLCIEFGIIILEALIGLYPGEGEHYEGFIWLVFGDGAIGFWLQMIALLGAIILLWKNPKGEKGITLLYGAIISLVAIFLVKSNLLQVEFFNPVLHYPGPQMFGNSVGPYFPSIYEIGLSVGIVALGCLLLNIGLQVLNLGQKKK